MIDKVTRSRIEKESVSRATAPQESQSDALTTAIPTRQIVSDVRRTRLKPRSVTPGEILILQQAIGNRAVNRLPAIAGSSQQCGDIRQPRHVRMESEQTVYPAGQDSEIVIARTASIGNGDLFVQRDDDATPPPQTNPQAQPAAPQAIPAPTSSNTPAASGTTPGTSGSTTVKSNWAVNWDRVETSSAVTSKSNARTGKESASGNLKIMPTGSAAKDWTIFPWFNAAPTGPVDVGPVDHPKDTGGAVSSDISFGLPPTVRADVTLDPDDAASMDKDALKKIQKELPAKKKIASDTASAGLKTDLMRFGTADLIEDDLNKKVTAAVGTGYKATVKVTQKPGANSKSSPLTTPYDKLSTDGERRTVNIVIPTKVQELKGSKSATSETTDSSKVVEKSGQDTTTTTDVRTSITTKFVDSFKDTYTKMVKTAKHDSTKLSGSFDTDLKGLLSGGGSFKDLKLNLGTLLALIFIEDPPLAFALKKAVGTMTVDGSLHGELDGELKLSGSASKEWTNDQIQQTFERHQHDMETAIDTNFSSMIQTQVNTTYSKETTDEHGVKKGGSSTTETVQVNYIVSDQPTLTVTSEAAPKTVP
jgi:hypothetical protein